MTNKKDYEIVGLFLKGSVDESGAKASDFSIETFQSAHNLLGRRLVAILSVGNKVSFEAVQAVNDRIVATVGASRIFDPILMRWVVIESKQPI